MSVSALFYNNQKRGGQLNWKHGSLSEQWITTLEKKERD